MKHTRSLCPECQAVVDAVVFEENGRVLIEKTCNEHGTCRHVYWSDAKLYDKFDKFSRIGGGLSNPMVSQNSDCPNNCGIHYATSDGRVIPLCTYNTLHRAEVEAKFSRPFHE